MLKIVSFFQFFYCLKDLISSKVFGLVVRLLLLYCGQFILFCLYGTKKLLPSHRFWFSSFLCCSVLLIMLLCNCAALYNHYVLSKSCTHSFVNTFSCCTDITYDERWLCNIKLTKIWKSCWKLKLNWINLYESLWGSKREELIDSNFIYCLNKNLLNMVEWIFA